MAISPPSQAVINAAGSVSYGITYTGAATVNLTDTDVTLVPTGTASCGAPVVAGGTTFTPTVTLSGCTGDGTVRISIAAGTSLDAEGNPDTGGGPGPAFTVDNTPPAVAIGTPSQSVINSTGSVSFGITYTGAALVNLTAGSITPMNSGTANCGAPVVTNGTTPTPTVTLSGCSGDGTVQITIAAGTSSDAVGNADAGAGAGPACTVDNTPPAVVFTSTPDITFSNAAGYVVSGDCSEEGMPVTVTVGGTVSNSPNCGSGTFTTGAMNVTSIADGASISVTAGHSDAAGNSNIASATVAKDTTYPDINLQVSGADRLSGETLTFGSVNVGSSTPDITFTIQNLGSHDLTLTGAPLVDISGVGAGDYLLTQPAISSIPVSGSATFTVTFVPTAAGPRDAEITIYSDDPDAGESPYSLYLSGTGLAPEIDFQYSGTSYASGNTFAFPDTAVGGSSGNLTFIIDNSGGTGALTISAPAVSGANAAEFTVGTPGLMVIPAGDSTTFTMSFNPAGAGMRDATLTIANDDPDETPYEIYLQGTGTVPEINLQIEGTDHSSGATYNFPATSLGSTSAAVTFTLENLGSADLNLTGMPIVAISGTNAGDFTVTQPAASMISGPSGNEDFTITFTPSLVGNHAASISIASDDADENPYVINLTGTGSGVPDINLQYGGSDFASGTGVGVTTYVGTPYDITFSIQNPGTGDLNVSYALTGACAAEYSISGPATVAAGDLASTFTITFDPAGPGYRSAMLEISTNDPDEPVYYVDLASCQAWMPDINIKVGAVNYPSTGSYDFGTVQQGASKTVTFTVQNTGTGTLIISAPSTSVPAVFNASDPGVYGLQFYNIPAGASLNITVTFTPNASSGFSDTLTINSNDIDESPYTINLFGNGAPAPVPDITLEVGSTEYLSGSSTYDFGAVQQGSTRTATFTIKNNGVGGLELSVWPWIVTGSTFSVTGIDEMSIPGGGTTTFTVAYTPDAADSDTGILSIASNDPDTPSYWINLGGTGSASAVPDIQLFIDGMEYPSGSAYDFGLLESGDTTGTIFTIKNNGTSTLNITPNPSVADTTNFSTSVCASTVGAGLSATFDVGFSPNSIGPLSTVLTISSDDPDEGTFTLDLNGGGYASPIPDIIVTDLGGAPVYPSDSSFDFGQVLIGGTLSMEYEVANGGSADLNITSITITGVHAAEYTIGFGPGSVIAPANVENLEINFDPVGEGIRTAALEITTDDPDEPVYVINLTGRGVMPVMVVHGGGLSTTSVYDPIDNSFSSGNPLSSSGIASNGSHSFLIESGSYPGYHMVLHGNGTATSLYNPADGIFYPGPATGNPIGAGAHSFKMTGPGYSGQTMVVCGGTSTVTRIYDPTNHVFNPGTGIATFGTNVASGAFSFNDQDGNRVIVLGNNNYYYQVFNQAGSSLDATMYEIYDTIYGNVGSGGHVVQITTGVHAGYMLIIQGASSIRTWLFYPSSTPILSLGPDLPATSYADSGSFSIPIKNGPNTGTVLIVTGGGTDTTSLYYANGTIASGPTLPANVGVGAFSIPITGGVYKGMFMIIHGNSTAITTIFNPYTLGFISLPTDSLTSTAGTGAHCFPAR